MCTVLWHFDYSLSQSKDTTARVVVARELGIMNSYTLEASFCGANFGRYSTCHFTTMHFEQVCDDAHIVS